MVSRNLVKTMKYRAKCTYCAPLLKNTTKLKKAHYYKEDDNIYIEVNNFKLANLIERLNYSQERTYEIYQQILNF